jgi:phage baseplate assembly protein W
MILLSQGQFKNASLEEHIAYCIQAIIFTYPQEHPGEPELGSLLKKSLYRQVVEDHPETLMKSMHQSLTQFEPRIQNIKIALQNKTKVAFQITYQIILTGKEETLCLSPNEDYGII